MVNKAYEAIAAIKEQIPAEERAVFQYMLDNIGDFHLIDGVPNEFPIAKYCELVGDKCHWQNELHNSLSRLDTSICSNENGEITDFLEDNTSKSLVLFHLIDRLEIDWVKKVIQFKFHTNIIPYLLLYEYGEGLKK